MVQTDATGPSAFRHLRLLTLAVALTAAGCDVSNNNGEVAVHEGDPAVVDFPIAYVHRPVPTNSAGELSTIALLEPDAFHPGAQLIVRDRASASAQTRVVTDGLFAAAEGGAALYDVKDLSVSADGTRLLFALRAPAIEGADDSEQPTWDIWLYDFADDNLQQVIDSGGDDVAPHFLASGRDSGIVFSSNRQTGTRPILNDQLQGQYSGLDDKRDRQAFALHTWNADGAQTIEQITYNVSHDLQPTVLDDGRLLFVRQDGMGPYNRLSLYTANPDGSDVQPFYGYHSQTTGTDDSAAAFLRPKVLADGRLLAILQPRDAAALGGDIIAIDGANFSELNQPVSANAIGDGQGQVSLSQTEVRSDAAPSPGGTYNSAHPFYDGTSRLLTSWSPCRLIVQADGELVPCIEQPEGESVEPAPPLFGLWIYNPDTGSQLPLDIPDEGYMFTDVAVMAPTVAPSQWQPEARETDRIEQGVGVVHIRSVYDIDGEDTAPGGGLSAVADPARIPTDERTFRFLRLITNFPVPANDVYEVDNSIFGRSSGLRSIIGYVPIEPDGSVLFKAPANIPFTFELVDAEGIRVGSRHNNWLQLRPGEERECAGCHTPTSTAPHGRRDAEPTSINPGAIGGLPFANNRLVDEFGTPEPYPQFGETMAEYYARINGPRTPAADIIFTDEWTDPAVAAPGEDILLRYVDIATQLASSNTCDDPVEPAAWSPPTGCINSNEWNAQCRSTINYLDSIAPLWQADRRSCDEIGTVVTDNTCTSCHTRSADGLLQVPAGQLELTSDTSTDRSAYVTSYVELLFDDNEQELDGGSLTDRLVPVDTGRFETDANGDLELNANGEPVPLIEQQTVLAPAPMSANGAFASSRFFSRFTEGGSHEGMLSDAELKLIAEWLDIGGQYYNNPFTAPAN